MLTIKQAYLRLKSEMLKVYDSAEAEAVCKCLLENKYGISNRDILLQPDKPFEANALETDISRLLNMEPVQYVCGNTVFMGLNILTEAAVLIPRPETEELVQLVIAHETDAELYMADICTGSGCIALSLRKYYPRANILALDVSVPALSLAAKSELQNFTQSAIDWQTFDVLRDKWSYSIPDVVVCNPPYIMASESALMDNNVLAHEPHIALFAEGDDPLVFYKKVVSLFERKANLRLYFELNPLTAESLKDWCRDTGLDCSLHKDLFGKTRFARIAEKIA